jgi:hypothetical protein
LDYYIRYIDLPCRVNAITVMDDNGFYNIYVNARLDYDTQQKAIKHELTHIRRDDFYNIDTCLEKIETM